MDSFRNACAGALVEDAELSQQKMNEAYLALTQICEDFFCALCDVRPEEQKRYRGRGEVRVPVQRKLHAPRAVGDDEGGAATVAQRRWAKQRERLREIYRIFVWDDEEGGAFEAVMAAVMARVR